MSLPEFDAATSNYDSNTLAITCGATATLLLACVVGQESGKPTGVTYNSVAMTQIGSYMSGFYTFNDQGLVSVGNLSSLWGLLMPSTGSSYNISLTGTTADYNVILAMSFSKASWPINYQQAAWNSAPGACSVTLTGVSQSDLLAGFAGGGHMGSEGSWTETSGQTRRTVQSPYGGGYGGHGCGVAGTEALASTAGSEAVSWSVTNAGGLTIHGIAVPGKFGGGGAQIIGYSKKFSQGWERLKSGLSVPKSYDRLTPMPI